MDVQPIPTNEGGQCRVYNVDAEEGNMPGRLRRRRGIEGASILCNEEEE